MTLDNAHYHGWQGKLQSPWRAALAIVRVSLLQILRRRSYWLVLALGLFNFLLCFVLIYAQTQFPAPRGQQNRMLQRFDFSPEPPPGRESGYIRFMDRQNLVIMALLAFSGSLLVGTDFQLNSLSFYLSRRIDRRHYIAGKLLAVAVVVMLVTTLPALVLYLEYGAFASSLEYFQKYWQIPVSILGYSAVMCTVLSIWLVTLSAYLQKTAPIAITWASVFVLLGTVAGQLASATGNRRWELLDPWRNIRYVGKLCFGFLEAPEQREIAWMAIVILSTISVLALAALFFRVRAVEIVE